MSSHAVSRVNAAHFFAAAFFAIIDLLAILPYYIEIALQADTVRRAVAETSCATHAQQSAFFRFSICT